MSDVTMTFVPRDSCGCVIVAFGKFTLAADSTIADCVIMKMIKSTRKMSVSGVMLISAMTASPPSSALNLLSAMDASDLRRLEHAAEADAELRVEVAHLHQQVVVEDDGDDRDDEAERRRDERLRDARGEDRESAGAHHGQLVGRL